MSQIKTKFLENSAVTTAKIANNAVDETKLNASVAGSGLAGGGGSALSVNVDTTTIEINSDTLRIAASAAGSGLSGGGGSALSVNVDNSTIEINADTLRVKDAGITEAKLSASVAGGGLTGGAGSPLAVGAGDGIDVAADSISVDVSDLAGTGLENDGSNNLRIAASAAGAGLTGGAGSALAVGAGSGISVAADSVAVDNTVVRTNGANAFTADQSHGGFKITNLADPTAAQDAATKAYVDGVSAGLDPKASVRAGTTAALPASTYNNGASGVGATLTANANGALPAQDGITLIVGNRLLVKNQAAALQNGIYTVTQVGDGSNPFILTRATDQDGSPSSEVSGGNFTFTEAGTTQEGSGWVVVFDGTITVGTDAIDWTQFSDAGNAVQSVNGQTGVVVLDTDDINEGATNLYFTDERAQDAVGTILTDTATIDFTYNDGTPSIIADVKSNSISEVHLTTSVAGSGLAGGNGTALSVNVDTTTIEINSDTLRIAASAAGSGLAGGGGSALSVNTDGTTTKITSDAVEALKHREEENVLDATDITNQYVDLAFAVWGSSASVNSVSLYVVGGPMQRKAVDYTVSLTGGAGGVTRITFDGDLETGGAAELVSGDVLVISYDYL